MSPDSKVETFAAVRLRIQSWRWQGVPFIIRAGKCLPMTRTEVFVTMRRPPPLYAGGPPPANHFRFRLGPESEIAVGATVKRAGEDVTGDPIELLFCHVSDPAESDAYEQLLGDAMEGEPFRFARQDYVEEAWRIVEPALKTDLPLYEYEAGTWGPREANALVAPGVWHDARE